MTRPTLRFSSTPSLFAALAAALLLLAGCAAPSYLVRVDAINDPASAPALRTYTLASGSKDLDPATLQFREASALLRNALNRRGYTEAPLPADAALNITIAYGIGQPETRTVTFSTPVYAELGGGRVQTVTKTTDATGKTSTSTQTRIIPGRYERVGNDVTTSTYTLYPKHLALSAREANSLTASTPEIWNVTAYYQSASPDLRGDLPILVTAIEPSIGENTGRVINVRIIEQEGRLVREPAK
ncbi:hypothetical protein [Nibricoccus aquaticus]|nr:hypothetical protein [Nibricoccus aquaticus]